MKFTLSTITTAMLLAAAPSFAQQPKADAKAKAKADGQSDGKMTVVSRENLDSGDEGQVSAIEIRVDNGQVTARVNGKDVPADRIKQVDGRIIIVDENGKELNNIKMFNGGEGRFFLGGNAVHGLNLGGNDGVDGEPNAFWLGADDEGEAPKVMIGVHMTEPGAALEKHLRLVPGKTAMITGVFEGLPAEVAGLGEYDIIVAIDDSDVADAGTIRKILTSKNPGDTCTLHVIQAGKPNDLKLKLQAFDKQKLGSAKLIGKEPDGLMFNTFNPLGDMAIDLKGLPQLRDRVFVAPDIEKWQKQWSTIEPRIAELQPQIQKSIEEAMKNYQGAIKLRQGEAGAPADNADVEAQLDRLDKRLEQLEALLGKLIEKQQQPKQ